MVFKILDGIYITTYNEFVTRNRSINTYINILFVIGGNVNTASSLGDY